MILFAANAEGASGVKPEPDQKRIAGQRVCGVRVWISPSDSSTLLLGTTRGQLRILMPFHRPL